MPSSTALALTAVLLVSSAPARAQEESSPPLATLHLADGTSVALLEWKLSYEYATWRQKEPVSSARTQAFTSAALILGKKSYPLKGQTLSLKRVNEDEDSVRVVSVNLKGEGDLKLENPAQDLIAPDLEKGYFFQPRSVDISGKTLSGLSRSFCVASFSALVECGMTRTTRVLSIDFN